MYRHHLDRPPENRTDRIRDKIRSWVRNLDWEDVFVFVHITLAFVFIVWGLEILLPWSIWRILVGLYIWMWVGADLMKQLWGKGIYLLQGPVDE